MNSGFGKRLLNGAWIFVWYWGKLVSVVGRCMQAMCAIEEKRIKTVFRLYLAEVQVGELHL